MIKEAFEKGHDDYLAGRAIRACPFWLPQLAEAWLLGWASAMREKGGRR